MDNVINAARIFQGNHEVENALQQILASEEFCKSARSSRLLAFLVKKKLSGAAWETSEYAIGIDVFDRDPATYSTCSDPIVRVQIGRLRKKLKRFYAEDGARSPICFAIPLGNYMPQILTMEEAARPTAIRRTLAVRPIAILAAEADTPAVVGGINEELSHQLHQSFGRTMAVSVTHGGNKAGTYASCSHCLEGSVRIEGDAIRTSFRLIDSNAGNIAWSAQFDRTLPLSIGQQEELALEICAGLSPYFAQRA